MSVWCFVYRALFILLLHISSGQIVVEHILHIDFVNRLTMMMITQTVRAVIKL